MKKKYDNKMMDSAEVDNKKADAPPIPTKLICTAECEMPGVGYWKGGDVITDQNIINKVIGNPNFVELKED